MYPEKTFRPDNLRLPFPTDREAPQATYCDDPKKYSSRPPPALGRSSAKSPTSLRKCTPKKYSRQTAFGFWSILCKKPLQPLEMYPEKIFPPDSLRLLVNPFRKISPATCCDDPKKYSSRQPSAFGQSPAKSHSSLWKCTPKKCSGQAASSFGEILCEKPLQPLEMYPEKIFPPDSFRLLVNSLQKVSPASGNVPRKDVPARQPPAAFSHQPRGSPSGPLR